MFTITIEVLTMVDAVVNGQYQLTLKTLHSNYGVQERQEPALVAVCGHHKMLAAEATQ
tara:strand:+ start:1690 stop:1863 length:174 start_codon:yes stop_codon:yes gene_type:complete